MITLTSQAITHIKRSLEKRGHGVGIRLAVKTTGCSGFGYVLEYVDAPETTDKLYEQHGVTIVVDPKSLVYLLGTQVDYVRQGLNEGFEFTNPNVKAECGCGESFTV